jgi:molybdopterin/thiamine biosynthesis adenylyltransferase/rhodanese-related sulfurtransferase
VLNEQREYFDRQIKLSQLGVDGQERLLKAHVLVIGAGGLGCPTLQYLSSMGVGNITVVDHDKVDTSNLHRQILFNQDDVGRPKALVACEKVAKLAPWGHFTSYQQYFDQSLANTLIPKHDLVIDCTDNFHSKFFIHDMCYALKTNLIQASIHKFDGQIQVFPFAHSTDNGCLRCLWEKQPEQLGNCNDNGVLGVVPGFFGTLQASEAVKLLLDLNKQSENEVLMFDLLSLNTHKMKYNKNSECHFCVHDKGVNMNDINLNLSDINPADYTWLDIRIATAGQPLPETIPANQIITKTDAEIIHALHELPQERPFLVLCDRGMRSMNFANVLREHGHESTYSLVGGFMGMQE